MDHQILATPTVYSNYIEFKETGLIPAQINFLPEDCTECFICTLEYDNLGTKPVYTACGHVFCLGCILHWVKPSFDPQRHNYSFNSTTCPMCRTPLFTVIEPEDDDYQDMLNAEMDALQISAQEMSPPYPLPAYFPRRAAHAHPDRRDTASVAEYPNASAHQLPIGSLVEPIPIAEGNTPRQYRYTSMYMSYPPYRAAIPPAQPSRNMSYPRDAFAWQIPGSRELWAGRRYGGSGDQQESVASRQGRYDVDHNRTGGRLQRALSAVASSVNGYVVENGIMLRRRGESWHEALDRWNAAVAESLEAAENS
ncbi:hypothetical protein MBLNU459_g3204t1 [Dothideomycetes sp. NU459]